MTISALSYDWGVSPTIIRMTTTSNLATLTGAGFWDLPATQTAIESINNGSFDVPEGSLFLINYSNGEGFFTLNTTTGTFSAETVPGALSETLANTQIFVGSAANIAAGVAMSGDATIANTGALTIANAAVTKAKLATAIQPAAVVKFSGKHTDLGGSATVTITATGVLTSTLVFAAIESSANAVSIQKVTPTANTITVLCSGDPGASVFAWSGLTLTP